MFTSDLLIMKYPILKPMIEQGHSFKIINHQNKDYSVVIENNVWIGANLLSSQEAKLRGVSYFSCTVVSSEIPNFLLQVTLKSN